MRASGAVLSYTDAYLSAFEFESLSNYCKHIEKTQVNKACMMQYIFELPSLDVDMVWPRFKV